MMLPDSTAAARSRAQTVRELYELIAALDRRVPHIERVGELSIARVASALKREAMKRIEELERDAPPASSSFAAEPSISRMRRDDERDSSADQRKDEWK
jgi:hypothetical protein